MAIFLWTDTGTELSGKLSETLGNLALERELSRNKSVMKVLRSE